MSVKRILTGLRLSKIAAVDAPCQEGATADIMKRAADAEAIWKAKYDAEARREMAGNGEAMSDGSYPIKDAADLENAIHAVGRGRNNSHAAIRAHIKRRAKALGLTDKLPETWGDGEKLAKGLTEAIRKSGIMLAESDDDEGAETFDEVLGEQVLTQAFWDAYYKGTCALQGSLTSILKDDEVTDKGPMVTQALQQFADYIEQILPGDVGKSLAASIAASAGEAGLTLKGAPMNEEIKKALGLPATATDAEIAKAIAELKKVEAVAKMSDKHKAYMDHPEAKLPKGGKDAFAEMSPGERDDHIKAHPIDDGDDDDAVAKAIKAGDAFRTPEGVVVSKRKVGDDLFAVLKSQNERLIAQGVDLAKAKEDATIADFAKRAEALGFAAEFGSTLRKAYGGDAMAQTEVEKRIGALQKQVEEGALFKNFGHNNPDPASAEGEFMAKVAEVKKAHPNLSDAQAYTKAYTHRDNADIVKRMKAEAAA